MANDKRITQTISWGQLLILCASIVFFLYALTASVSLKPPAPITDFKFTGSTLYAYTGNSEVVNIPSSYSYGDTKLITGTVTFNSRYEARVFMQEYYAVGAEGYYDFYNEMYNQTYPWIYNYAINQYSYVEGDDITVTTIKTSCFENNTTIKKAHIPGEIKKLEWGVFRYCTNLEEVYFEDGNEEIGDSAFMYCEKLKKVRISNTLKRIWAYAFFRSGVETLEFPSTLKDLHIGTWYGCTKLKTVKFHSTSINANHVDVYPHFGDCTSLQTIYVPNSALSFYRTTSPWNRDSSKYVGF